MAKKSTEYKVLIEQDGKFQADVICRGERNCGDVVNVFNGFSKLDSVKDKPDTVPNFNELHNK